MTEFPNSTHPAENGKRKIESRKLRYVFFVFVFVFVRSYGQPMSLSACMDYAVGHATAVRLLRLLTLNSFLIVRAKYKRRR